jgi:two-component system chemotaxis response regulator CheV
MSGVCVRVRVGAEHYALDVSHVSEVDELGEPTPVPGAPAAIVGVHNVRGQVVPVVDVASLLGLAGGPAPKRVVIAEEGRRRAALAVHAVDDVAEALEPSEQSDSPLVSGVALVDGVLVGMLDLPALLSAATAEAP